MAILDVIKVGHPTLRKVAEKVTVFDKSLKKLAKNMFDTMIVEEGIGLAAPQVNHSLRLIVIDMELVDEVIWKEPKAFVNPEIISARGAIKFEEGCLSVPEFRDEVDRFEWVKVSYQDCDGITHEMEADGILAVVFQHEIDHLNGILFIDKIASNKEKNQSVV